MSERNPKFRTSRTEELRKSQLSAEDERTISHIEDFGCSVVHVRPGNHGFGWSYTIGIFDTCGKPELITVGLLQETAHYALNKAARLMREGADLENSRHRNIVGEVECEFRPVDSKWVEILMTWGVWYYGRSDIPVLQLVYPDHENRFPEDNEFEKRFEQPLMQPGAAMTRVENDFWASQDPKSSLFDWKFSEPPHTRVFLSETVHKGTEAVTYVSHDADDGAWQFLGDSMSDGGGPIISCFHHPIDSDLTLVELADLPQGWYAVRAKVGEPWIRKQHEADADAE